MKRLLRIVLHCLRNWLLTGKQYAVVVVGGGEDEEDEHHEVVVVVMVVVVVVVSVSSELRL